MIKKLISLCMIVKNEEKCLHRCLSSVKDFVDEIIIVDTGSNDNTKSIAKKFTDKVFDMEWENDFSKARNFAFSKATGEYVMWLDADDFIPLENLKKLMVLKNNLNGKVDVYMLKYEIAFDNQGNSTFTYFRERIVKNDGSFFWQGAVHEVITPHGKIEYIDIAIQHLKIEKNSNKRNLKIYQSLLKKGKTLSPRELYYYSRELYYNGYYKKAISQLNKFLKIKTAWKEDRLGAIEIKALCQIKLNKIDSARKTLFESFELDAPRANILCQVGDTFLLQEKFNESIFWYENALNVPKNYNTGGFVNEDYYGIYPALQLCLAYFKMGEIDLSISKNNLALSINPKNEIALENDKFFKKLT